MSTEKIESWRDLLVWQKAHAGALEIYRCTKNFPPEERYRLIDQLCGAAVSVPTNIAEGKGRGSIEETRYLPLLAKDLGFLPVESHTALESLYTEISKMTNALLRSLKTYSLRP
jgi:four helix bundle protein